MKKMLFVIALVISMVANAQNDTTIVKKDVRFDKETYTSKSGDTKEYYYAYVGEVCYSSNKTSYERYKAYRRFGIKPTCVLITNKKGKRIIIL
jgi:hypothetical protein